MSDRWRVELGDCLAVLERMEADSVDAVVTDPPYGLEFMGAEWDKPWAVRSEVPVGFAGREGTSLPSHRDGRNPTCRTCGGRGRGATRCACPTPEWDRSPAQDMRDFQAWSEVWLRAVWRVLKPGGHLLAFGGTRTAHRLACAAEDAGFEIRDRVLTLNGHVLGPEVDWIYGTGWPKSMNVGKAIDAAAGVEREVVGSKIGQPGYSLAPSKGATVYGAGMGGSGDPEREAEITAPATPEAEQWEGWGTALKPAHEPIVVARKPFRGTVISNVLERGTGALNIDACRIATGAEQLAAPRSDPSRRRGVVGAELQAPSDAERNADAQAASIERANRLGRWPANVALIHAAGCQRVGVRRVAAATTVRRNAEAGTTNGRIFEKGAMTGDDVTYGDGDGMETVEAWECEQPLAVELVTVTFAGTTLDLESAPTSMLAAWLEAMADRLPAGSHSAGTGSPPTCARACARPEALPPGSPSDCPPCRRCDGVRALLAGEDGRAPAQRLADALALVRAPARSPSHSPERRSDGHPSSSDAEDPTGEPSGSPASRSAAAPSSFAPASPASARRSARKGSSERSPSVPRGSTAASSRTDHAEDGGSAARTGRTPELCRRAVTLWALAAAPALGFDVTRRSEYRGGCPVALLNEQSGVRTSGAVVTRNKTVAGHNGTVYGAETRGAEAVEWYGDTGSASRFFYSGKASPAERDAGLDDLPDVRKPTWSSGEENAGSFQGEGTRDAAKNTHPTVKPIDLMRWLIRLVAPPGALVLDPFGGSGSTVCAGLLEGVRVVAIEREENFAAIARTRATFWASWPIGTPTERVVAQENARRGRTVEQQERRAAAEAAGQLDLLATPEEPDG